MLNAILCRQIFPALLTLSSWTTNLLRSFSPRSPLPHPVPSHHSPRNYGPRIPTHRCGSERHHRLRIRSESHSIQWSHRPGLPLRCLLRGPERLFGSTRPSTGTHAPREKRCRSGRTPRLGADGDAGHAPTTPQDIRPRISHSERYVSNNINLLPFSSIAVLPPFVLMSAVFLHLLFPFRSFPSHFLP